MIPTLTEFVKWLNVAKLEPTGFVSASMATGLSGRTDHDFVDRSTTNSVDLRTAPLSRGGGVPA